MQGGVVLPLSPVQLFGTPWTAACQASLSFSICLGLLKLMSAESVMLSNVVHCRREWQITSVFLPPEPHEQYERAKMQGLRKADGQETASRSFLGSPQDHCSGGRKEMGTEGETGPGCSGGHEGWLDRYNPYPSGTAAPREGAWLWEGAPTGENWGDRARPVEQSLLPSTR